MKSKCKLQIGIVEHGWFPIIFTTNESKFYIDASDIPIDPILELIKAIEGSCLYDSQSEAWFSLEPFYLQVLFIPENDEIKIEAFYVDESGARLQQSKENKFSYVGNKNELLVQFWRGLKEFCTRENQYLSELANIETAVQNLTEPNPLLHTPQ